MDDVTAEMAVISAGKKNRNGQRGAEKLERLELRNIPLMRTERQSVIKFLYRSEETEWRTILENKK